MELGFVLPIVYCAVQLQISCTSASVIIKEYETLCFDGSIREVRIPGCSNQPCKVKKGLIIPIEVDFQFKVPISTNSVSLLVIAPNWNVPGSDSNVSTIAEGHVCEELKLGLCPMVGGKQYTLMAKLFVDPMLESLEGKNSTGTVQTLFSALAQNEANIREEYGCVFLVTLNLVD